MPTDPVSADLERWKKACERWRHKLGLYDWTLTYTIDDGLDTKANGVFKTGAKTTYTPAYKMADIAATRECVKGTSLKEAACHEMVHLRVAEPDIFVGALIRQLPEDARELATDNWEEIKERLVTEWQLVLMR
jgi:hypothetical protein